MHMPLLKIGQNVPLGTTPNSFQFMDCDFLTTDQMKFEIKAFLPREAVMLALSFCLSVRSSVVACNVTK